MAKSHFVRALAALTGGLGRPGNGKKPTQRRPFFEALEQRTLLTVVFDPIFGVETEKQGNGEVLKQPPINIVFWGPFWQGSNGSDPNHWDSANSPEAETIMDTTSKLIASTYFNVTNQYGADGSNMFINDTAWDPSDPGTVFDENKIDDVIQNKIDNGPFPEPDDQTNGHGVQVAPIYLVVTPPNVTSSNGGAAAFNTVSHDAHDLGFPIDFDDIGEVWVGIHGTNGDNTVNADKYSKALSHEVGEIMTDFDEEGFQVNTPPAWHGDGDAQIGDKEGNAYTFRMTDSAGQPSIRVQPLWSRADSAWVVTDGTTQTFNLHPLNWDVTDPTQPSFSGRYALTINGDQLGINDSVTLGGTANNGVVLTLNGETVNFDPSYLSTITLNMGAGSNTVHLTSLLPSDVSLSMNCTNAPGGIILQGPDNVANTWNITGADRGRLLSGIGTTNYTFSDVESIIGGNAGDDFKFLPGGSISSNLNGGGTTAGGSDVLDFTSFTDFTHVDPVTVNLQSHTATPLGGTFSNIPTVVGTTGVNFDTLVGPNASSVWDLFAANDGILGGITFLNFENLSGGSGNDQFHFEPFARVDGNIDGGLGLNTLDYSAQPGPVTVNFTTGKASDIGGSFMNIGNVIGSAGGADTIVGPDAAWIISGVNSGSVNGITFSSFENLTGSPLTDTFTFLTGGSISGNVDGGGGNDTLDYSNLATPVTVNFTTSKATGIGGTFSRITGFAGGQGANSIVGPAGPTSWSVIGVNKVSAFGLTLTNFPTIVGGPANDTFAFLTGGRLDGRIDGGGGINTLTYAGYAGTVLVNLPLHTATGVGQGIFNIQNVTGGAGNSLLVGDANANTLVGGSGRNILIGGNGADSLVGGGGDNILIGEGTIWDTNNAALLAIFAEWTRTDLSFERRVDQLQEDDDHDCRDHRLNGNYFLTKRAIVEDRYNDKVTGTPGLDWFIVDDKADIVSGKTARDVVTKV